MTASARKFRLTLLTIFGIAVLVLVPAAFAGKGTGGSGGHKPGGGNGGTGGSGSLSLVLVSDVNSNGVPNWNDQVTYTVSTTATAYPYVSTQCSQGSTLVLSTSAGFYSSYAWPGARTVPLESNSWTGGAASCTARLYSMDGGSQTILATLNFSVDA